MKSAGVCSQAVLYTLQYYTDCCAECSFAYCVHLDSQVAFRLLFRYNLIKLWRRRSNFPGHLRRVLSSPPTHSTVVIVCFGTTRCMNLCPHIICVLSCENGPYDGLACNSNWFIFSGVNTEFEEMNYLNRAVLYFCHTSVSVCAWVYKPVALVNDNFKRGNLGLTCKFQHVPQRKKGARRSAVGWGTALQVGRSRFPFPMVSLEFFIDIILPAAPWPWGRPSL